MPNFPQNVRFFKHLSETISKAEYDRLQETLDVSRSKLTRLQSGQDDFTPEQVHRIKEAALPNYTVSDLVMQFRLAWSVASGDELDKILRADGDRLDRVPAEMLQDEPQTTSQAA